MYLELIALSDAVGVLHLEVGEALAELVDAELEDLLIARIRQAAEVSAHLRSQALEPALRISTSSICTLTDRGMRTWGQGRRR